MNDKYKIWQQCLCEESEIVVNGKGNNVIPEPKQRSLWLQYLDKCKDPLIVILCVILVLSCGVTAYEISQTGNLNLLFEPVGVLLAIFLSTGLAFYFELRSNREFRIRNKVKDDNPVKVIRRKSRTQRPRMISVKKCDVVVGDLVSLEPGDEVPADGLIVEGDVRVDESAYTGETYTVKGASVEDKAEEEAYSKNFLLRGSMILDGICYYKVTEVGVQTEEGKGAIKMQNQVDVETPLNQQLAQLGKILTTTSYVIAGLILVERLFVYFVLGDPESHSTIFLIEYLLSSIMIAVTLIVVAVPEGLPMSVTVSLALSMRKMLKQNNLVRKLHACETMGAATVICTDKTGTLTQNKMTVVAYDFPDVSLIVDAVAVNSTAELTEREDGTIAGIGNPTEIALINWIKSEFDADYVSSRESWKIVEQVPFSTETKFMATQAVHIESGRMCTFYKGAPEIILSKCKSCSESELQVINETLARYQNKAMRTLAFAVQEKGKPIIFMGIVGIADPVREGVKEAVEICSLKAGVRVIMVTGDVAATAKEIGREISLVMDEDPDSCLTGLEFAEMDDEEILKRLPKLKILSRAKPADKARLVELLQRSGEVVAVTGDGTNDAMALKKAQVGLSMGDGTARAKEVSDITILDNSFSTINSAILWGRSLYLNIRRFIIFQMTINVCACLVVLIGAFSELDFPLTVTQMLWVNLIMDTFAAMALSSLPADKRVMYDKPRNPKSHIIDKRMLRHIFVAGIGFCIFLMGFWQLLWHSDVSSVRDLLTIEEAKVFFSGFFDISDLSRSMSAYQSGIFFSTFVFLQFWNLFNTRYYRTGRSILGDIIDIALRRIKASEVVSIGFITIVAVILLGQILIVNLAGNFFNVAPLSIEDWALLLLVTSPVMIVPDIYRFVKTRIIKGGKNASGK